MPESFRIIKRNGIKFVELDNEKRQAFAWTGL